MNQDQAARLWEAETAAYRTAVEHGVDPVAAVERARLNHALQMNAERWSAVADEMNRAFAEVARNLQRIMVPAMAKIRDMTEQHPHLFGADPDPRQRALELRRTRNTGPGRGRLDGRRR